jgi:hypothetical protein
MLHRTRYFVIASLLVLAVGLGTGLVAYYVGFPGGTLSNDLPPQLTFVPADATVVAYADVHQLMASELRQQLRERFPVNGQQEFAAHTGIDIEHDVDSVVGFLGAPAILGAPATGAVGRALPQGLALIRGRFNRSRIETRLKEHGGHEEPYSGATILGAGGGADVADGIGAAFLDADVFAIGHIEQLRRAIDRKTAGDGATTNRELIQRIRGVNGQNAWVVGRFDALVASGHLPAQALADVPAITWLSGSLRIDHTLHLRVQADTSDAQAASDLRGLITGVLAVGKLQRAANPALADIARSIVLAGSGNTVTLSFDAAPQLLESIHPSRTPEAPAQ